MYAFYMTALKAISMDAENGKIGGKKEELRLALLDYFFATIQKHKKTLFLKLDQTTYKDDYGNIVYDKFFAERDYFIDRVLTAKIPRTVIEFLFDGRQLESIFDELFMKLEPDNNLPKLDIDSNTTPTDYEQLCCSILKQAGWDARNTQISGDQGVDVLASLDGRSIAIQCKLYATSVGNSAVQEVLAGQVFYRTDFAAVVTNAGYTASARSLANTSGVLLLHHSDLPLLNERLGLQVPIQSNTRVPIVRPAQVVSQWPLEAIIAETLELQRAISEDTEKPVDPLYDEAVAIVLKTRKASVPLIQRHLRISYNRAAIIIEKMEEANIVSPMTMDGSRQVLVPPRDFLEEVINFLMETLKSAEESGDVKIRVDKIQAIRQKIGELNNFLETYPSVHVNNFDAFMERVRAAETETLAMEEKTKSAKGFLSRLFRS